VTTTLSLDQLRERGDAFNTEISREYGLSLSTVLFRANRNVELGHLERVTNPGDGRSFLLRLTGAGHKVWAAAGEVFMPHIVVAIAISIR